MGFLEDIASKLNSDGVVVYPGTSASFSRSAAHGATNMAANTKLANIAFIFFFSIL